MKMSLRGSNPLTRAMRFWHTLRWLQPVQIWGRLWFRIYRPRPDLRPPPAMHKTLSAWCPCARTRSMTGPSTFRFLGVEHKLNKPSDWNRGDWSRLWLYNLHYFDDLIAADAAARNVWHRALIERWITENPPARGSGWEPYPASLRIVNWLKWSLMGNTLDERARTNLAVQIRWLRRRLEVHLLGNHLWANAKALVFAGALFQGREAKRWREKGLEILRRELDEQILDDGGHFERSPMYHAIVLEDLLDLVQLGSFFPGILPEQDIERWRDATLKMLYWQRVMTHPDGGIAFFNDSAFDIAPSHAALLAYARSLGLSVVEESLNPIEALTDSGYIRLESGLAVLIADVGEIGPDYLPGHAHADTLSFEFSLQGRRVLVNEGTSTYEPGEERLSQRGTAAHNTVQVADKDSSEVWGSFRVARRAKPFDVSWKSDGDELRVQASHDGYRRIGAAGRVERVWRLAADRLQVQDRVEGKPKDAIARFRAHPSFVFNFDGDRSGTLRGEDVSLRWSAPEAASVRIVPGAWHPRFGATEVCQVLELGLNNSDLYTEFSWA